MLRNPYDLGGPQRQARGAKSEGATSPLPSRGPKRGRKCYATPTFWGVTNAKRKEQNQKWLPHPCLLGGTKEGGNATSPLHSWGSPTPSVGSKTRSSLPHSCVLGGPKEGGNAMSTLCFWPFLALLFKNLRKHGQDGFQNLEKWIPHCKNRGEGVNWWPVTPPSWTQQPLLDSSEEFSPRQKDPCVWWAGFLCLFHVPALPITPAVILP